MPQLADTTAINYDRLPQRTADAFRAYFEGGIRPGYAHYLMLCNNLRAVVEVAPDLLPELPTIYRWLYYNVPANAWGSLEVVEHWMNMRRLERKKQEATA